MTVSELATDMLVADGQDIGRDFLSVYQLVILPLDFSCKNKKIISRTRSLRKMSLRLTKIQNISFKMCPYKILGMWLHVGIMSKNRGKILTVEACRYLQMKCVLKNDIIVNIFDDSLSEWNLWKFILDTLHASIYGLAVCIDKPCKPIAYLIELKCPPEKYSFMTASSSHPLTSCIWLVHPTQTYSTLLSDFAVAENVRWRSRHSKRFAFSIVVGNSAIEINTWKKSVVTKVIWTISLILRKVWKTSSNITIFSQKSLADFEFRPHEIGKVSKILHYGMEKTKRYAHFWNHLFAICTVFQDCTSHFAGMISNNAFFVSMHFERFCWEAFAWFIHVQ